MHEIFPKRVFPVESKIVNSIIEFWIFELDYLPNIGLKLTILTFWKKFAQKGPFPIDNKRKEAPPLNSACSNETSWKIFLNFLQNLVLNWQFWHFGPNLLKKGISDRKRKNWKLPLNSAYSIKCRYQISA